LALSHCHSVADETISMSFTKFRANRGKKRMAAPQRRRMVPSGRIEHPAGQRRRNFSPARRRAGGLLLTGIIMATSSVRK
jgi:hypothetical protein